MNRTGKILRGNSLLHSVIKEQINIKNCVGPGRRLYHNIDNLKVRRKCWVLKEEAEDRIKCLAALWK